MKSIEKLRDCTWIGGGKVNEHLDAIEAEIAERYMLLPTDMDDEPIHIGDKMQMAHGQVGVVVAIGETQFTVHATRQPNVVCQAKCHRHVKPNPLKELFSDAALAIIDVGYQHVPTIGNVPKLSVDKFKLDEWMEDNAERIRELMKEGGDD